MEQLKDCITKICDEIRKGNYPNEASVSQGVVKPILHSLGWPVFETRVVSPEYTAGGGRVDYALCHPKDKPAIFIEVKMVGKGKGADRQLFEYAFHQGVQMAVLTDGQEWHFYLPAEQGNYEERRFYKLDLLERSIEESAERFERYLGYKNVCSKGHLESAREDHSSIAKNREANEAIPKAWAELIDEQDSLLLDLIAEKAESLCGYKPELNRISEFLSGLGDRLGHRPVYMKHQAVSVRQATVVGRPSAEKVLLAQKKEGVNTPSANENASPFRVLGYSRGQYFYLPDGGQRIVSLTPMAHTKQNLNALAPLTYWESRFGAFGKTDWDAARDALLLECKRKGCFNEADTIRGRGAWLDANRAVFHLGDKLIVDGREMLPHELEGQYVYEGDMSLNVSIGESATDAEAMQLSEICTGFNWAVPVSGILLTGWSVIAPVCGIFRWRPHIWITGDAGTGESSIVNLMIRPLIGQVGIYFESCTTEAAIRQTLKHDARPIIYDEADTSGKQGVAMLQAVLSLSRAASSGATIRKGTVDGEGRGYAVRAAFCYSSKNPAVREYADESRISMLTLLPDVRHDASQRWMSLKKKIVDTVNAQYGQRMFARSLKNLKTLQTNAETFIDAVREVFPAQRACDQTGTLLAGAYLCYTDKTISLADATAWVKSLDWGEQAMPMEKKDSEKLLDRIATTRIRMMTAKGAAEATIGELILFSKDGYAGDYSAGFTVSDAKQELRRIGISVDGADVFIANSSVPLKKILEGTPWAHGWRRALRDIQGTEATGMMYFTPGINARAVKIPIDVFEEEAAF